MVRNDSRERICDQHRAAAETAESRGPASLWRAIVAERRDQADRAAAGASRMGWSGAETGRRSSPR